MAIFFSSFIAAGAIAGSEYDWKMVRDEDGIQIYLKKIWADEIQTFRGVIHINSSIDSILAVILDINACAEWVHHCKAPLLLVKKSFSECYHYQIHQLPFPLQNREFFFHSKATRSPHTGTISIQVNVIPDFCVDNDLCPAFPDTNYIRVDHSHGEYLLEPINKNQTRVTWTHHTNPGGHLPEWLINSLIKKMPFYTLQGLRKQVFQNKYQKKRLRVNSQGELVKFDELKKE